VLKLPDDETEGVELGVGNNPEPDDDTVTLDDAELPPPEVEGLVVSAPDVAGTVTVLDPVLLSPVALEVADEGSGINKLLLLAAPLDAVVTTDAELAVDVALPLPLTDVLVTRDVAVTVTVTSPLVVDVEFVPGGQL
jgi:hypothetical protein